MNSSKKSATRGTESGDNSNIMRFDANICKISSDNEAIRMKLGDKSLMTNNAHANNVTKCKLLDENFNFYYLLVVSEAKEKVLLNNFLLSGLKEPWSKGKFFLRKK